MYRIARALLLVTLLLSTGASTICGMLHLRNAPVRSSMQRQHQPAAVWLTETGTNKIGVVNPRSGARCGSAGSNLSMPQPGTWTATCPMEINRVLPTMTRLSSGKVLMTGGCDGDDYFYGSCSKDSLASAELYAPSTGRWTPTSSMGTRRSGQTATLLPDGHVLVSGAALTPAPRSSTRPSCTILIPVHGSQLAR